MKPVLCTLCGTRFTKKRNMIEHVRAVHEGRKDHSCSVCNKPFFRRVEMNKHFKAVHEKKNTPLVHGLI
jgi:hypothetical protein